MLNRILSRKFFNTFVVRGITALGQVSYAVILGWLFGPEGVGLLALAQSIMLTGSTLARFGQNTSLLRFIGSTNSDPKIHQFFYQAQFITIFLSIVLSTLIFIGSSSIEKFYGSEDIAAVLPYFAISIVPVTFCAVNAGFFKGLRMPATGCLAEFSSITLVAAIVTLTSAIFVEEFNSKHAAICFLASTLLVTIGVLIVLAKIRNGLLLNWQEKRQYDKQADPSLKRYLSISFSFLVTGLSGLAQNVLVILIAGYFLTQTDLGLLRMADRLAIMISFPLIVINSIYPPLFSKLHSSMQTDALHAAIRDSARACFFLSTPVFLLVLIFGEELLNVFGEEFVSAYPFLIAVSFGQWINAITGSVGFVLSMTGHEKILRNIAIFITIFTLINFTLASHYFGVIGAAVALGLSLALQNLMALYFVKNKLGFKYLSTT